MELLNSPKIFKNYKSDFPKNTIDSIENGFKKIGLNFVYKEKKVSSSNFSIYSGKLINDELGFSVEGKGLSPELAKASAFAELAERFSAGYLYFYIPSKDSQNHIELLDNLLERKFLSGFCKNNKDPSTSFDAISLYFKKKLTKKKYEEFKKAELFDNLVDIYCLSSNKHKKIPIKFIDMIAGSTGLASGNTIEEAIVQATCEIFERYAASLIMSQEKICPTIDIKSIKDERILNYIEMLHQMNFDVIIKDFSMNNHVPTIGVLLINNNIKHDKNKLKKSRYFQRLDVGSHLNINEAILRGFTEHLQGVNEKELRHRKKSDILYDIWTKDIGNEYIGTQEKFRYFTKKYDYFGDMSFLRKGDIVSLDKIKNINNNDFLDDIDEILDICKKNNWDFQVIDCTHKILKFPVVRVVIPQIMSICKPFMIKLVLDLEDDEKRFNFFYDIDDFYRYVFTDDWFGNKKEIKKLIENIENSLSRYLYNYQIDFCYNGYFYNLINLFYVLARLNMSIKRFDCAFKYFQALKKIGFDSPFDAIYFRKIYENKYNNTILNKYIDFLSIEKEEKIDYNIESNLFRQEENLIDLDEIIRPLLININNSFSPKRHT